MNFTAGAIAAKKKVKQREMAEIQETENLLPDRLSSKLFQDFFIFSPRCFWKIALLIGTSMDFNYLFIFPSFKQESLVIMIMKLNTIPLLFFKF